MMLMLQASVGQGGQNQADDVKFVRALLNVVRRKQGDTPLAVDGSAGQELAAAIARFQVAHGVSVASGLIKPASHSWQWLLDSLDASRTLQPIVPPGRGRLTWEAEGQEGGRYHSRVLQVPSAASGLRVGRGYDLRLRSRVEASRDLAAAGVESAKALQIAGAVHLQGDAAWQFIIAEDLLDYEISPEVQLRLFELVYRAAADEVQKICARSDMVSSYGPTHWPTLDSRIQDVLVDLYVRGDYTGANSHQVQPPVVANDVAGLAAVMASKTLWSGVPPERRLRRHGYLK
ncbi:hypothetical protein [uncultured Marinobacter sp.]|uniref:hypothetical protein n=1 Tax=uncultured Marinobacter sp. TaxID=187379 RepID=UPI0030D7ABE5